MELQGRTYMTNGQSILMKEYEDVNKAQNNLDFDFQKSLGSVGYQTSSKFPPNQENKKAILKVIASEINAGRPVIARVTTSRKTKINGIEMCGRHFVTIVRNKEKC